MVFMQRSPSSSSSSPANQASWLSQPSANVPSLDSFSTKSFKLHNPFAPRRPTPAAPAAPSTVQARNPLAPLSPDLVHNGDPKQGTLLVLAQMHRTTDPNNPLSKSPNIARSQGVILETLLQAKPSVVFFEGHHSPMEPGDINPEIKQAFQRAFDGWKGMRQRLTQAQADLLRRFGADVAYACLAKHPVHLPITEDLGEMEAMMKRVQDGAVLEEEAAKIHTKRDRHFAEVLKAHFKQHPGSTAFFVVGAVHDLTRQCDPAKGFDPQLLWYNTSGLPTKFLEEQQKMVYSFAQ